MYTDIIKYKLAEGVNEKQLLKAADEILHSWMKKQPGFVSWQINTTKEGYVDIVVWDDKHSAQLAEAAMKKEIDENNDWYACYDFSSIRGVNAVSVKKWS